MNRQQLIEAIKTKKSFLCIGLDTDYNRIPKHLLREEDPVYEFNKAIIDATHDFAVAYKPNLAFYESRGSVGLFSLERTTNYLNLFKESIFTIADAKRGDIGNTCNLYAKAYFEHYGFDAITLAPYMGEDSINPFLAHEGKWSIILALTSNKSYSDFQSITVDCHVDGNREQMWENVIRKSAQWGNNGNTMYVVGATRAEMLGEVRKLVPDHFLLVPGVGSQGGSLEEVAKYGMTKECGMLVNSSRGIIFASEGEDFADRAREEAMKLQKQMEALLEKYEAV